MAKRPIFVPTNSTTSLVDEIQILFDWEPGFSLIQKRKNISTLHRQAKQKGYYQILEISTKSESDLGIELSAFNLTLEIGNHITTVENFFQSSKVFENGGPYTDLLDVTPKAAKQDERLQSSGKLKEFNIFGNIWKLTPKTSFYDYLYLSALNQHPRLSNNLVGFDGFSDIEFNPLKSINCQARSAAMYVSLINLSLLEKALFDTNYFLSLYDKVENLTDKQLNLPI